MQFTIRALALTAVVALAACSTPETPATDTPTGAVSPSAATESTELTVVTHDSFTLPDDLKARFAEETGYEVTYLAPGDAGALVNQLVLTKDSPLGDVVFGIDNSFASRANDEGILVDYPSPALPAASSQFDAPNLTPIDYGDVCINADTAWFEEKGLPLPTTFDDLAKPEYKDLLVVSNPASSSPGLSFLVATIGAKGDGYLDYWRSLMDNGTKVVSGWSEAYYTDFSAGGADGPRPLVLSYSTSPAFTIGDDGESTTEALLGTCFRQVEYAGVLKGAENEVGAQKFIDFMLTPEVQAAIPENLYMYPVVPDTPLPEEWVKFAPLATTPIVVTQEEIGEKRDEWIRDWTEATSG